MVPQDLAAFELKDKLSGLNCLPNIQKWTRTETPTAVLGHCNEELLLGRYCKDPPTPRIKCPHTKCCPVQGTFSPVFSVALDSALLENNLVHYPPWPHRGGQGGRRA